MWNVNSKYLKSKIRIFIRRAIETLFLTERRAIWTLPCWIRNKTQFSGLSFEEHLLCLPSYKYFKLLNAYISKQNNLQLFSELLPKDGHFCAYTFIIDALFYISWTFLCIIYEIDKIWQFFCSCLSKKNIIRIFFSLLNAAYNILLNTYKNQSLHVLQLEGEHFLFLPFFPLCALWDKRNVLPHSLTPPVSNFRNLKVDTFPGSVSSSVNNFNVCHCFLRRTVGQFYSSTQL